MSPGFGGVYLRYLSYSPGLHKRDRNQRVGVLQELATARLVVVYKTVDRTETVSLM